MNSQVLKKSTILHIDQDKNTQEKYAGLLEKNSKHVYKTTDLDNILTIFNQYKPDIIVTDIGHSDFDVFNLIKEIKEKNPYQIIVINTKNQDKDIMLKAFEHDVDGYHIKHEDEDKLISKLLYLAKKQDLRNNNLKKRETLENILENQSGLIFLTNFKDISYASNSFLEFFALDKKDDIFDRYENLLDIFMPHKDYLHAKSKEEFIEVFNKARAVNKVVLLLGKDFNPKAFHINLDTVKRKDEIYYIISLSNISLMQEQSLEVSYKAYVDSLTGISNRNKFEEVFDYEYKVFTRYKTPFCLAVLDIDHFKKFNDTYGHLIGDEVLSLMANEVNDNTRETDTFARWGGEEFILLMSNTKIEEADIICEKLRVIVENICHIIAGKITCSFGVTQIKENDSLKSIMNRSDEALYEAKAAGRNRVIIKN